MPEYHEERDLPFMAEELFDLAADVESYPEFLPWWAAARVVRRERDAYYTDQVIRLGMIRQRFTTHTRLRRPHGIDVTALSGPFRRFDLRWRFTPLAAGGCRVRLQANVELASRILEELLRSTLVRALGRIVAAFEERARMLYGTGGRAPTRSRAADTP